MSLMDAPQYDPTHDNRVKAGLIGGSILFAVFVVVTMLGYILGHGWLFTNLHAEHRVNDFMLALEAKDFGKAYDIYNGGKPNQFGYTLQRFTEDWTPPHSDIKGELRSHHVDVSRTDGTGVLGTDIIVGVTVNGSQRIFFNYIKSDGTLTCCSATHIIQY